MDLTGKIQSVSRDYITRKPMISFIVNENIDGIEDLNDKDLVIKVSKRTKPRSLDSNAYFHVLCDKIRQKLGISMAACKNDLITSYGQIEYIDDTPLIYKTNAPVEYMREQESVHMQFIKMSEDGANWYRVYRGSHTYNTQEMHKLLLGTIAEAQSLGISTATHDEIARMQALWQQKQ